MKKLTTTLLVTVLISCIILRCSILTIAQPPTIVKGYVYINGKITQPDEVHLTFPSQSRIGTVYSDGRYIIVFTGEDIDSVGEFYIIYNKESYIPSETVIIEGNQTVYEIDLHIEIFGGGNESSDDSDEQTNIQPMAVAGGPYHKVVGESIYFDASESYDSDGIITKYEWNFGDDINKDGKSTTHSYSIVGNYRVILTVTDNKGKSDLDITYAYITETPNNPPIQPILNGTLFGSVNILYNYTIFSIDIENNAIQYVFNWGDETNITSSHFQPNGTSFTASHSWSDPGVYALTGYAIDNNNVVSKITEIVVLIDTIYCGNIGYMSDYTSDGFFDLFYSNTTGEESIVEQVGNLYLIDEDNNGEYDYKYNFETKTLALYSDIDAGSEKSTSIFNNIQSLFSNIIIILAFIVVLIILIISFIGIKKRKKEKINIETKKENSKEKSVYEQGRYEPERPKEVSDKNKNIGDEIDKILENKN